MSPVYPTDSDNLSKMNVSQLLVSGLKLELIEPVVRGLKLNHGAEMPRITARKITLTGSQVSFVPESATVLSNDPITVELILSNEDILEVAKHQGPDQLIIKAVICEAGALVIQAEIQIVMKVAASVTIRPEIVDKTICLRLDSVSALGLSPKHFVQSILDRINPIFDGDTMPVPVQPLQLTCEDNLLKVTAEVRPPFTLSELGLGS